MKEISINPDYKTMWKVECELNEKLKQQLEAVEKENRGLKMMLNHVAGVEHVCDDLEAKLAEAVEVIEFYGNGVALDWDYDDIREQEDSDFNEEKQLSFKGKKARQFLAKYRGEK